VTEAIAGVEVAIDAEAVVVASAQPLTVLSSAVAGGGLGLARTIVNLHVRLDAPWDDAGRLRDAFVARRGLPAPAVALLTAAWTERAEAVAERRGDVHALVVATVGLGNAVTAGWSAPAAPRPGTINTIVVVDGAVEPAALVNLALTVTETKTLVLVQAGLAGAPGRPASGTSTDAVVVAATGRGPAVRFGGPVSEAGWAVARAAREALASGVRRWLAERR
jgi:adenosylcobinamide amidohydrolase